MRVRQWITTAAVWSVAACLASAQQQIAADAYLDKLYGMWLGEVLGNYAGRGLVPGTDRKREGYVVYGGADFDVGWGEILANGTWVGDDDTALEYMYLDLLKRTAAPGDAEVRAAWTGNVAAGAYYIAHKQARWLMEPAPLGANLPPPQTGSLRHNMHWYAIDAQIATESVGAVTPGMRQRAAELCGQLARISNDGYAVHAAQYYAAMYAAAAFDSDIQSVVAKGLAVVPVTSRTYQVIRDVQMQHAADPEDWRSAQRMLHDRYGTYSGSNYRYRSWIESTVNVGLTTMALLYGQGDFRRTVEIGVLGGYDADCNPATAGGLIGLMKGYRGADGSDGILAELPSVPAEAYDARSLRQCGALTTISQVAAGFLAAAEAQILAAGGTIQGEGAARIYTLPEDILAPPLEKPDPSGPKGLVGRVLQAGGTVSVAASIERRDPRNDRRNLDAIIDGITDVSYNGHMPYTTDDGGNAQPEGGDYYELRFGRPMTFRSVVFYEGDMVWNGVNSNPRQVEPLGGYFLDLVVEVCAGGAYRPVSGLHFSEPLDAYAYFQRIELTFDPAVGDRIRIRGNAGGVYQFTSIVELEAYGAMGVPGDADEDGDVDHADLLALKGSFGRVGAAWQDGDFDFDGDVDAADYVALKEYYGTDFGSAAQAPEPAAAMLLLGGAAGLLARRRRDRAG